MTHPVRPITNNLIVELLSTWRTFSTQDTGCEEDIFKDDHTVYFIDAIHICICWVYQGLVGETVTLQCFYKGNLALYFMWYKQTLGDNPQIVSTFYRYNKNATFYHEFKGNTRFSVQSGEGINHLKISDMQLSDSATYYCGNSYANQVEFGEGAILIVKGSGSRNMSVLQQPVSESVQPGDSVTLNCTIHTETYTGEHSVYWFRHGSGEFRPGIIYTHGERSDQCENRPETGSPSQSCVYNLPKRNQCWDLLLCCGLMWGTKLDNQEYDFPMTPTALALVTSNIVFVIVIILLTCGICNERTRGPKGRNQCSDMVNYAAVSFTAKKSSSSRREIAKTSIVDAEHSENQDSDVFNYAAVSFTPKKNSSSSRRAREKTSREDAVYSEVRYLQQQ
ncbi:unnamed protein product [Coregonus sp. 'balchen']|nr:unnamed protein product [Coregonus sp. 'balchen']